jgi:hypothetical protein
MKPDEAHSRTCDRENCPVCASWRREKRQQAKPYLQSRGQQPTDDQTTLDGY